MSASLHGPTARGRYRRGPDLSRQLRAGILNQDDCGHDPEKGREAFRMDPNEPILRKQVARDYPDQTQGEPVETCTTLTTQANELMRSLPDRMPVILDTDGDAIWLVSRASSEALRSLFVPHPGARMEASSIGVWVNNPKN
jgi:hypothetical protein